MSAIPRDRMPDSSVALLRDGYRFIPKRARRHRSDVFATRLMFRRAVCVTGPEAAEMFYQPDRFRRVGAMPSTTFRLLQDAGSVQSLEGEDHRHRKAMFMEMMSLDNIDALLRIAGDAWRESIESWSGQGRIVFLDEMERLLTVVALRWTGLEADPETVERRTREFSAMLTGSGSVGTETARGLLLRQRTEFWARRVIRKIRSGKIAVPENAPAAIIAHHRDLDSQLLPAKIAGVELINVLRPIVAIARYIVFSAHALSAHPGSRRFAASESDAEVECFAHEVRRFYPFFPFIGGVATSPIEWNDHTIEEGDWVILDIYGTNHDQRTWTNPERFDPARFRDWDRSAYTFIPQGGGELLTTHRCAGEWITIALLKQAARMLTTAMTYDLPKQDLSISLRKMPAQPASGLIMANVRPA